MEKIFVFIVALKRRKSKHKSIEIERDQTLGDFDSIIRHAFGYDTFDHLSEFYKGKILGSEGYGEIYPDGSGSGSDLRISQMRLSTGEKLEYVYDFGDDIQHVITLEKIIDPTEGIKYPRILR